MHSRNDFQSPPGPKPGSPSHTSDGLWELPRRIFRCWHREMSRPFTDDGETYRVCLNCGARRQFLLDSWKMVGNYYRVSARNCYPVATRMSPEAVDSVTDIEPDERPHVELAIEPDIRPDVENQRRGEWMRSLRLMASTTWQNCQNTFVGLIGNSGRKSGIG